MYISGRPGLIHRVDTNGTISVVAGDGNAGYLGDGAPGVIARVNWPRGIATRVVEGRTELLVADWANNRVRRIDPTPSLPCVARLAAADRFGTAVHVSHASFGVGAAGAVVLARGDDFPDALAAVPLAARLQGPLLLTASAQLHPLAEAELLRVLRPGGPVHLVGGTGAVSAAVEQRVRALGYRVERHAGATRFDTAAAIARRLGNPDVVMLTTGEDFPDALGAGAAAGSRGGVVLLTSSAGVPGPTRAFLDEHPAATRYAVGGPAARVAPDAIPLVGPDRFATAAAVARHFFPDASLAGIASASAYADALSGGAHLGRVGAPLLLTAPHQLPDATRDYLAQGGRRQARLFGGRAVLHDTAAQAISDVLRAR